MMARTLARTTSCLVALALLAGCGTFENMTNEKPVPGVGVGGRQVYGGVRHDFEFGSYTLSTLHPTGMAYGLYLLGIDLPLSLLGDTATLPWTIGATFFGTGMSGPPELASGQAREPTRGVAKYSGGDQAAMAQ